MPRVIFETFGCRLNIAESAELAKKLRRAGYEILESKASETDFIVINTCTVTSHADSDARNFIRRAHRNYPSAFIIVIGCYAQVSKEEIEKIEGVSLVLGNDQKKNLLSYLQNLVKKQELKLDLSLKDENPCEAYKFWAASSEGSTLSSGEKTRAFLKIQDGCNYFCSYCIIPYARGLKNPSSMRAEEVLDEIKKLEDVGFLELVLTGINLGTYGDDHGESFLKLLQLIEEKTSIKRVRLSSIEPNFFQDELIDFLSTSQKVMSSFHIPLQSGSDKILELMKRRYKRDDFKKVIESIKKKIPHAFIGTDFMCAFPGETDRDFEEGLSFVRDLRIDSLHVFPYSPRKATAAYQFQGQVDPRIKKERVAKVLELSERKKEAFMTSLIGGFEEVLLEKQDNLGFWGGHGRSFLYVKVKSDLNLSNQIKRVKIKSLLDKNSLFGELIF